MKKMIVNTVLAVALMVSFTYATSCGAHGKEHANEETKIEVKKQTVCPVMGGAIDSTLFVEVEGRKVYVCCAMCIDEVKKDPAKYLAKLDADLAGEEAKEDDHKGHQ